MEFAKPGLSGGRQGDLYECEVSLAAWYMSEFQDNQGDVRETLSQGGRGERGEGKEKEGREGGKKEMKEGTKKQRRKEKA